MQLAILEKKGLREEELQRRREPMARLKREERRKQERRREVLSGARRTFEEAVASNFGQVGEQLVRKVKSDCVLPK